MIRPVLLFLLGLLFLAPRFLRAADDGPPIAITSPDAATTFAYGSIKDRALLWDSKNKMLFARIVFTDAEFSDGHAQEDEHEFRFPGVRFDAAKGIFYAVSAEGETIPVARVKKALFFKTIEVLPNAVVRIEHPRGNVTAILEAISPNDPAMHAPPPNTSPDDSHNVNINSVLH